MNQLVQRARRAYREEGLRTTLRRSLSFIPRYVRHFLGKKWLHRTSSYRRVLIWWNSGRGRYSAQADPFKVVRIDPDDIRYVTGRGPYPGRFQFEDLGLIRGGNWDLNDQRVNELPVVQAVFQRYQTKTDWENNDSVNLTLPNETEGLELPSHTCKSDMPDHHAKVDSLYKSIKEHGYLSKRELVDKGESTADKYFEGDQLECYNEIAVDIGRNGQFLFVDGRHRLAIAKVLDIDEIPVRISARHAGWQHKRESYAESPDLDMVPDLHRDHPDMQDILPKKGEQHE